MIGRASQSHARDANGLKALAARMALPASTLGDAALQLLHQEEGVGSLSAAFVEIRARLLPNLTIAEFADIYAQVSCVALFAEHFIGMGGGGSRAASADFIVQKTLLSSASPLESLLAYNADPRRAASVESALTVLKDILRSTDFATIIKEHEARQGQYVLSRFYEHFLAVYSPHTRAARGVYYTPEPLVAYMVRSVNLLLKSRFSLPEGLGSGDRVSILDPAVGSGAFLHGIIDFLYTAFAGDATAWSAYVAQQLLPRLVGFELLPAPYVVALLSLTLKLGNTGYRFRGYEHELRVYLANALEAGRDDQGDAPGLVRVILGNPPYANFGMLNKSPAMSDLLADYKRGLGERKLNLDDDFIKFLRLAQWQLERAGSGILAFVTSHTYLDGITHRRMRQSLLESFDEIYILDLHGNSKRRDYYRDGSRDENVFGIQQGVAIGIFVRKPGAQMRQATVRYAEMWGSRTSKNARLAASDVGNTDWTVLEPQRDHYFFVPRSFAEQRAWGSLVSVREIFPLGSTGIKTHLDAVLVGETDERVMAQVMRFIEAHTNASAGEQAMRGSAARKALLLRRELVEQEGLHHYDYAYRALDTRRIAYRPRAIEAGDHRYAVMRHVLAGSIMLLTTRQLSQEAFNHAFVSDALTDMCLLSTATRECAYCFPLYLYDDQAGDGCARRPNLAPAFTASLATRLELTFVVAGRGDLQATFGPEDIFDYIYAVLHAPGYRRRYAECLRIDFPRVPWPADIQGFRALCRTGNMLVDLHLLRRQAPLMTTYPVDGTNRVEIVRYDEEEGAVWINARQRFGGVSAEVWNFRIGDYQVCRKWLKERRGRELRASDVAHYHRICAIALETLRLTQELDAYMA